MTDRFFAWAIDTRSDGHGFIGRYWWFAPSQAIPVHMKGCYIALFETRKTAREYLPLVRRSFPKAVPVKVMISIDTRIK